MIELGDVATLALALLAIGVGHALHRVFPRLAAWHIPAAITGGLCMACLLAMIEAAAPVEIRLATGARHWLLLLFFACLGLSAKLAALWRGGVAVAALCLVIATTIVLQNAVGVALARGFGLHDGLGLFLGSIPFVGGHGTAAAWSQTMAARGIDHAFEVGMACATLGLIAGGLAGGPVATWLMQRRFAPRWRRETAVPLGHDDAIAPSDAAGDMPAQSALAAIAPALPGRWRRRAFTVGAIAGSVLGGTAAHGGAPLAGWTLPAFLVVMLVALVLTNLGDLLRSPLDTELSEQIGGIALRLFLAISMTGLQLGGLRTLALPLLLTLAVQTLVVVALAVALVYPLLGRGYQAAVASGGYIGFALGAMPVGLGVMRRVTDDAGPAPHALMVVTLAAALFADAANAFVVNLGFAWLG